MRVRSALRLSLTAATALLALVSLARPASASATANFQGDALQFSLEADFDATRPFSSPSSCSAGTASYSWDFGDGHTGTGNPVHHEWASSGNYSVQLTVTCSGNNGTATRTRVVCFSAGVPGCIAPSVGFN